jgi:DNA segregation ATPase FtsK/SpoIIIE, S-DNA-T family
MAWLFGVGLSLFLQLALWSYDPRDPGWSYSGAVSTVYNAIGPAGALVSDWLLSWFGFTAFVIAFAPILMIQWLVRVVDVDGRVWLTRALGTLMWIPGLCIVLALHVGSQAGWLPVGMTGGGILGSVLAVGLVSDFGLMGAALTGVFLLLLGLTLAFRMHWPDVLDTVGGVVLEVARGVGALGGVRSEPAQLSIESRGSWLSRLFAPLHQKLMPGRLQRIVSRVAPKPPEADVAQIEAELLGLVADSPSARRTASMRQASKMESEAEQVTTAHQHRVPNFELEQLDSIQSGRTEPRFDEDRVADMQSPPERSVLIEPLNEAQSLLSDPADAQPKNQPVRPRQATRQSGMALPDLSLLDPAQPPSGKGFSQDELTAMGGLLERRLAEFGVEAEVVAINPGPVVTRFEIDPAPGVKVSRITNLAKDVARSLAVISVRVVEVIPGKSTVGIEIPNQHREMVRLTQILDSDAYRKDDSVLTLALGHDISGQSVCANLAKMPHLLVAGTTGSGKSVGVNAMLLSMLYKARPEDLRLILVDPKMLELAIYEGIPHLLAPVVTDMKDAANALRWCVAEMERRYKLMAELGVRNLEGFNTKIREHIEAGTPLTDPTFVPQGFDPNEQAPELATLPFIVVVIDEFADMMMIVGKKVDQLIARLAQKARAAGIHLILATQRPSVDVITGLIKANIPSRISFQVSSKIDSRTVLDQGGAEQLLGNGDMLYLPSGKPIPVRVHGAFVDDHEVHNVVNFWKLQGQPAYEEAILQGQGSGEGADGQGSLLDGDDEADALYDEAVAFVTETRRASISAVQRKLKIGYNRAARMIEAMEAAGVVSEMGSNGAREVLAPPPR